MAKRKRKIELPDIPKNKKSYTRAEWSVILARLNADIAVYEYEDAQQEAAYEYCDATLDAAGVTPFWREAFNIKSRAHQIAAVETDGAEIFGSPYARAVRRLADEVAATHARGEAALRASWREHWPRTPAPWEPRTHARG